MWEIRYISSGQRHDELLWWIMQNVSSRAKELHRFVSKRSIRSKCMEKLLHMQSDRSINLLATSSCARLNVCVCVCVCVSVDVLRVGYGMIPYFPQDAGMPL